MNAQAQGQQPQPETLNNVELGYRKNWQKAALNVNLYYMGYEDQLIPTGAINDVGAPIRVNVPKSYRAGIELVGGLNFTPKLRLEGSATFSQNKIDAFREFTDVFDAEFNYSQNERDLTDTDIALSPNVIANAGFTYDIFAGNYTKSQKQSLAITLLGKYVGEQYLDNTSNENAKLDDYFFSDFRLNYTFKTKAISEIGITLLVQNVFDGLYQNTGWVYRSFFDDGTTLTESNLIGVYPQAERNYLVGLNFKF